MSNDRKDAEQLTLDFEVKFRDINACQKDIKNLVKILPTSYLSLVVDNSSAASAAREPVLLDPNSPEITRIILDLGRSLGW